MRRTLGIAISLVITSLLVGCGGGGGGGSAGITISVDPSNVTVTTDETQAFSATVTGTSDAGVDWSVQEAGCGTIVSTGEHTATYTAPSSSVTCHVVATSRADPTKTSTALVKVFELPPDPPD